MSARTHPVRHIWRNQLRRQSRGIDQSAPAHIPGETGRLSSVQCRPYAGTNPVAADDQVELLPASVAEEQNRGAVGRFDSDAALAKMDLARRDRGCQDFKEVAPMDLHI